MVVGNGRFGHRDGSAGGDVEQGSGRTLGEDRGQGAVPLTVLEADIRAWVSQKQKRG